MSGFDKESFGRNIRVQRAVIDISQGELARRMGVNIATVGQYEKGEMVPGADKLWSMAVALGCSPNDLFGW